MCGKRGGGLLHVVKRQMEQQLNEIQGNGPIIISTLIAFNEKLNKSDRRFKCPETPAACWVTWLKQTRRKQIT